MSKGLWATPDYIRQHGEWNARFMTRMIDGVSLEEAQKPDSHWNKFEHLVTPQAERDYKLGNDTVEER